jgi:pseudaminic acid biosynthesis-associated methylase
VLKRLRDRLFQSEVQARQIAELKAELATVKKQIAGTSRRYGARIDILADLVGSLMYPDADGEGARTNQEAAWSGQHGFRYVVHHLSEDWKKTRVPLWSKLLEQMPGVQSVAEFGCNIGANLKALHHINPSLDLAGVEINRFAVDMLKREGICAVQQGSIATVDFGRKFDLVFSRGVLIHIQPEDLPTVYANMERHAGKYLVIWENFSETPYHFDTYSERVTGGKMGEGYQFWRDFAGDFQKQFPIWSAVSSGVDLKAGAKPKHGDLVWTIMQRR